MVHVICLTKSYNYLDFKDLFRWYIKLGCFIHIIDKYYFDNDKYRVEIYPDGKSKLFENKTNKERRCEYSIYRSVVSQLVDIRKYEKHK